MTQDQIRELKTILFIIASRLPSKEVDDATRLLLYKAQSLADDDPHGTPGSTEPFEGGLTSGKST